MLLTIPRMNVYSAIGDYQIASTAITANNNNFQLYKDDKEKPSAPGVVAILITMVVFGIVGVAAVGWSYTSVSCRDYGGQHLIYPDHRNYSKYNFSQFDNTTV